MSTDEAPVEHREIGNNGNGTAPEVLVKSRERVRAYGEVFTPRHMVNRMLDLVQRELETAPDFIDKTFLEPAAGDGNFLVAILRRKFSAIERHCRENEWPVESLFALASIYGIELLNDNHKTAQATMLNEFLAFHQRHGLACEKQTDLFKSAQFLIEHNIVQGNTLTGLGVNGRPITLSWWHRVLKAPATVQREAFTLTSLREASLGMFDFAIHPKFSQCRIDRVYKGVTADD